MTTLPTISLHQPYASLIACGAKPFETRHWAAPQHLVGQRVAIHAAARKPTRHEAQSMTEAGFGRALGLANWNWEKNIPYGAIVCTARFAGQARVRDWDTESFDRPHAVLSDLWNSSVPVDDFGDYAIGRWIWEMRDVEPLDPPVPAKGHQGWWTWSEVQP